MTPTTYVLSKLSQEFPRTENSQLNLKIAIFPHFLFVVLCPSRWIQFVSPFAAKWHTIPHGMLFEQCILLSSARPWIPGLCLSWRPVICVGNKAAQWAERKSWKDRNNGARLSDALLRCTQWLCAPNTALMTASGRKWAQSGIAGQRRHQGDAIRLQPSW